MHRDGKAVEPATAGRTPPTRRAGTLAKSAFLAHGRPRTKGHNRPLLSFESAN